MTHPLFYQGFYAEGVAPLSPGCEVLLQPRSRGLLRSGLRPAVDGGCREPGQKLQAPFTGLLGVRLEPPS
jgi:hypothetical protein